VSPRHPSRTRGLTPGLVVFARGHGCADFLHTSGAASIEWQVPITDRTRFNVGSVAKQVTAQVALAVAALRAIDLERTVQSYLPEFGLPHVTVKQALQHTGGIRDAEAMLSLAGLRTHDHYTATDLLSVACRQHAPAVKPGAFLYSNTGYLLVTEILHRVTSRTMNDLAQELVFTPAHMTDAQFKLRHTDVIPAAASSYVHVGGRWIHAETPVTLPGPGSLWCSAQDLRHWLEYLSRSWEAGQYPALITSLGFVTSDRDGCLYGSGLYSSSADVVFHEGHEQGFSAATYATNVGRQLVVLSNNAVIDAAALARNVATRAMWTYADLHELVEQTRFNSDSLTPAIEDAPPDPNTHRWLGTYRCAEAPGQVRLSINDGTLCLWRRGTCNRLTRTPTDEHRFDGPGFSLVCEVPPLTAPVLGFTIDLVRAPGLKYELIAAMAEQHD